MLSFALNLGDVCLQGFLVTSRSSKAGPSCVGHDMGTLVVMFLYLAIGGQAFITHISQHGVCDVCCAGVVEACERKASAVSVRWLLLGGWWVVAPD